MAGNQKPAGGEPMIDTVPTGADVASDGSSVETTEDVATLEEIPSVEEITRKGKKEKGTEGSARA